MNFEEYIKEYRPKYGFDTSITDIQKETWNACKQEILKILKENIIYSREEGDIIYPNIIDKIEKL